MDRDEILKKSRQENRNRDLEELEIQRRATSVGMLVGVFLCGLVEILGAVFDSGPMMELWFVFFGVLGTVFAVKFSKLRKRHELVLSIVYYLFAAADLALFVRELVQSHG